MRGEVHVSLPYEPARAAFASLSRTATDLAALAGGDLVELPARSDAYLPAGLARLERGLFGDVAETGPLDGSIRFLEGAGRRATLELVAEAVLDLVREGTAPEEIAVVCPALERVRASLETAFGALGIPFAIESRSRLGATAFGQALLSLLRFTWSGGTRRELFSFLRTPYSGVARPDVDFLEGRLRGRAVLRGDRTLEETTKLRTGRPLPMLELIGSEAAPVAAARAVVRTMLAQRVRPRRAARDDGCEARPARGGRGGRRPRRARAARGGRGRDRRGRRARGARARDGSRRRGRRAGSRRGARPRPDPDATVRRRLRDRARAGDAAAPRADVSLPRRRHAAGARQRARRAAAAARHREPRPLSLLHGVHAAAEAADARARGGDRRRLTAGAEPVLGGRLRAVRPRRRPPAHDAAAARASDVAAREAPTERERLRALARLAADEPKEADALAFANGWQRKLGRARRAFSRPTAITHPRALALLGEPRDVQGHRPRADGRVLGGLVRRALPAAGRDRPGDRPPHARLDRARGAAALLQRSCRPRCPVPSASRPRTSRRR